MVLLYCCSFNANCRINAKIPVSLVCAHLPILVYVTPSTKLTLSKLLKNSIKSLKVNHHYLFVSVHREDHCIDPMDGIPDTPSALALIQLT